MRNTGTLLAVAVLVAACGGKHEQHGAATATARTASVDHSAHAATAADPHAGHDMSAHGDVNHSKHAATTDHSAHAATTDHSKHTAATDHSAHTATTDHTAHGAARDHSPHVAAARDHAAHANRDRGTHAAATHDPHAHHRTDAAPAHPAGQPQLVRTEPRLEPDAFDAPAAVSVAEAAKAQGGDRKAEAVPPHSTHETVVYVCPMHPEVTSDKPGSTCPKCGMALVKK